MVSINLQAPLEDILPFVKQWLQLLSEGKLTEACALIDEPAYDDVKWTPELILEIVSDTFSPESRFYRLHPEGPMFTSPYDLEEQTWLIRDWLESGLGVENKGVFYFDYNVPLNGAWSDLSALFEFHRRENGCVVVLRDLEVL